MATLSKKIKTNTLLENKLNQLWHQGYVVLHRWELLSWYGKDRITSAVWRDIWDSWEEMFDGEEPEELKVIKCDETTAPQKYVVVNDSELVNINTMN
ncbi:MAG: hypothetical protein V3U84_07615 [Thiotrichaceae bacterium]